MAAKVSRRLVIDASVARSSGGEDAVHPLSKHCRDFLKGTLTCGHRVVLSPPVNAEWKKHESVFARTWRSQMVARRRVSMDDIPEDAQLREAIEGAADREQDRLAMIKDAHLVEAAQATDHTVVSLDDTVRRLFGAASTRVRSLRTVVWANPRHPSEGCSNWLTDGAPPDKHRRLRAVPAGA
jgi:predicted nucleic acid-binding protein